MAPIDKMALIPKEKPFDVELGRNRFRRDTAGRNLVESREQAGDEFFGLFVTCPIPGVCIDGRRLPLFIARATLRELIAGLEARATVGAAK